MSACPYAVVCASKELKLIPLLLFELEIFAKRVQTLKASALPRRRKYLVLVMVGPVKTHSRSRSILSATTCMETDSLQQVSIQLNSNVTSISINSQSVSRHLIHL